MVSFTARLFFFILLPKAFQSGDVENSIFSLAFTEDSKANIAELEMPR